MRSKGFGWAIYIMLVIGIIGAFMHTIMFQEKPLEHFNSNMITYKKDGKTYFDYKGQRKPSIDIDINKIDYENNLLHCMVSIPRFENLTIRLVNIMSWDWGEFEKSEGLGPYATVYFIFPSEEEIYQKNKIEDLDHLSRQFSFKVSGNPTLYPFDSYNVEISILILHVPDLAAGEASTEHPRKAVPLDVTTRLREYLPGFYVDNRKNSLSFQKDLIKGDPMATNNMFSFRLVRIKFLRYFTVYIYTLACIFLAYIAFRRNVSELLGQALGYFAALWGIRGIITAKIEVFPTIIDYLTLGLYSVLVLIVAGRLLHQYYSPQKV